jgi:uncharacterized protein (DUF983 family)
MFASWFKLNATCPVCGVRFERRSGESVGGVMINLVVVELISIGGFVLVEVLTDVRPIDQLIFWLPFAILFPILFYPFSRALWVVTSYLQGGVRGDPDDKQLRTSNTPEVRP